MASACCEIAIRACLTTWCYSLMHPPRSYCHPHMTETAKTQSSYKHNITQSNPITHAQYPNRLILVETCSNEFICRTAADASSVHTFAHILIFDIQCAFSCLLSCWRQFNHIQFPQSISHDNQLIAVISSS